jgi:N-methylhydantoinase A
MHGTTVATNTVLTGTGARCGLVTTKGYRQVLQIARSFVPGGLGGWVIYNKSLPMAPLALTIEADERVSAKGEVVRPSTRRRCVTDLRSLKAKNIEALTVSLINSFANPRTRSGARDREGGAAGHAGVALLRGRAGDAGVRAHRHHGRQLLRASPRQRYVKNLQWQARSRRRDVKLHILRSDGGLASAASPPRNTRSTC